MGRKNSTPLRARWLRQGRGGGAGLWLGAVWARHFACEGHMCNWKRSMNSSEVVASTEKTGVRRAGTALPQQKRGETVGVTPLDPCARRANTGLSAPCTGGRRLVGKSVCMPCFDGRMEVFGTPQAEPASRTHSPRSFLAVILLPHLSSPRNPACNGKSKSCVCHRNLSKRIALRILTPDDAAQTRSNAEMGVQAASPQSHAAAVLVE